jgi:hypothetical protein
MATLSLLSQSKI